METHYHKKLIASSAKTNGFPCNRDTEIKPGKHRRSKLGDGGGQFQC
jgi:hypothetical protein